MNPIKLTGTKTDGTPCWVLACGECGFTVRDEAEAVKCCAPSICACGAKIDRWRTQCSECLAKVRAAKESETFSKAKKVPASEYVGWVFCATSDKFYASPEECSDDFDGEPPEMVWACLEKSFSMDAREIVCSELERAEWFEEAEDHVPTEMPELQAALDSAAGSVPPCQSINYDLAVVFRRGTP